MADPATDLPTAVIVPSRLWRRVWTRSFWRTIFTSNLSPRAVGCAFGVGAAVGVAPLPGFQMATVGLLCWGLRLNFPLALLASNISLGPLLVMWAAIAASLGRWLRLGIVPWHSYASFIADFNAAPPGWSGILSVVTRCLLDWLLGSLLLAPTVGIIIGLTAWAIASVMHGARRRRRERAAT